jgi:hypothetical protein
MKRKSSSGVNQPGSLGAPPGSNDRSVLAGRKNYRETQLQIPAGEPDLEALRSVTREWLVPLLVEKFLREQGIELRARPNASPGKIPISNA